MFFDVARNLFLIEGVDEIPSTAIAVDDDTAEQLMIAMEQNSAVIVVEKGELQLINRPSAYHHWNGTAWQIDPEQQQAFLKAEKTRLLRHIAEKTDRLKADYLAGYSQAEIDSFYRQEQEARGELPLMLLSEIFEGRDDLSDIEQLKEKVIEKADLFAIIMGKNFAIKQSFELRIEQAPELETLNQIEEEINRWQSI